MAGLHRHRQGAHPSSSFMACVRPFPTLACAHRPPAEPLSVEMGTGTSKLALPLMSTTVGQLLPHGVQGQCAGGSRSPRES